MNHKSFKLALVYDRVNKFGGAERVLQALHEIYPAAPLYTSVYHPKKAAWAKGWDVRPSFINRIPFLRAKHEWLAPLMPYAFESLNLSDFDVVLSVTSAEAKGIILNSNQLHLCYLLTPTRYLWSHTHEYLNTKVKKILMSPFISSLRRWDYVAAQRPDYLIPISRIVAKRCLKYYRRLPEPVIYPPVETEKFKNHPKKCYTAWRNYFLIVSRAVSYKRTRLVIKTFLNLPEEKLVIIGESKPKLYGKNICAMGMVTDDQLACYYHHAKALIFPQEEDFGITAIEAQSAGIPVIAYRGGGAMETIIEGETGVFFASATISGLTKALKTSANINWYDKLIRRNAVKYDKSSFKAEISELVESLWEKHQQLT